MNTPIPAQKEPYGVTVEAGKRNFWCACGRSDRRSVAVRVQIERRQALLRRYARHPVSLARAAAGAALAGLLALLGCSWFSASSSKSASAEACPGAVVLRPLAATAVFAPGPERRPENVAFYGLLSEAELKCKYTGDAIHIDLDSVIVGERGPAARGDTVDLPYFVAVTAPDQTILSKKPFAVSIAFEASQKRSGVTDHIEETIPLGGRAGADLNVVLGFQQSPE